MAKVQEDNPLQEQLKAEGADPVAIAKATGCSINTKDLEADSENLSDEELEDVASGGCWLLWTKAEPGRGALSVYRRRPCR
ncbi:MULTISPECIES: Nif11-like leader peptide family RiPP precursor [Prochlorococcus]|uniref:Nif11-like leader peptide family RiPP precursor n=1 Tax=Prochlorococcus TaxID=1218 RepID=UPI001F444C51|nr:Nif11-like leader peptide family RiPP precursor [Prochlorococcus marinus]